MWQTPNLGDLLLFFGPLEFIYDPIFYPDTLQIFILSFWTLTCVCTNAKFDSVYGDKTLMPKLCEK